MSTARGAVGRECFSSNDQRRRLDAKQWERADATASQSEQVGETSSGQAEQDRFESSAVGQGRRQSAQRGSLRSTGNPASRPRAGHSASACRNSAADESCHFCSADRGSCRSVPVCFRFAGNCLMSGDSASLCLPAGHCCPNTVSRRLVRGPLEAPGRWPLASAGRNSLPFWRSSIPSATTGIESSSPRFAVADFSGCGFRTLMLLSDPGLDDGPIAGSQRAAPATVGRSSAKHVCRQSAPEPFIR